MDSFSSRKQHLHQSFHKGSRRLYKQSPWMMSGPQQALSTHELSQGKIHNSSTKIKLSHLNLFVQWKDQRCNHASQQQANNLQFKLQSVSLKSLTEFGQLDFLFNSSYNKYFIHAPNWLQLSLTLCHILFL